MENNGGEERSTLTSYNININHSHPQIIHPHPPIDTPAHNLMLHHTHRRNTILRLRKHHKWFMRLRLRIPQPNRTIVAPYSQSQVSPDQSSPSQPSSPLNPPNPKPRPTGTRRKLTRNNNIPPRSPKRTSIHPPHMPAPPPQRPRARHIPQKHRLIPSDADEARVVVRDGDVQDLVAVCAVRLHQARDRGWR